MHSQLQHHGSYLASTVPRTRHSQNILRLHIHDRNAALIVLLKKQRLIVYRTSSLNLYSMLPKRCIFHQTPIFKSLNNSIQRNQQL